MHALFRKATAPSGLFRSISCLGETGVLRVMIEIKENGREGWHENSDIPRPGRIVVSDGVFMNAVLRKSHAGAPGKSRC